MDITELLRDALEESLNGNQSRHKKRREDRQKAGLGRLPTALRKYMQGQRVLADYLRSELEEMAGMYTLLSYSETPETLYKSLRGAGFVWNDKLKLWRLDKRLKEPRDYEQFKKWLDAKRG